MMSISFGWTTPALLAGAKSVTRRDWAPRHARRFHRDDLVAALDRDYRYGGRKIAVLQLMQDPVHEPPAARPLDYAAEGFVWMEQHEAQLGAATRRAFRLARGETLSDGFHRFMDDPDPLWVIRFRVAEWLVDPEAELARMLGEEGRDAATG